MKLLITKVFYCETRIAAFIAYSDSVKMEGRRNTVRHGTIISRPLDHLMLSGHGKKEGCYREGSSELMGQSTSKMLRERLLSACLDNTRQ